MSLSLVPNRNVLLTPRVPWCQWDLRETQSHWGSHQPDMSYIEAQCLGHRGCCRGWNLGAWAGGDFVWPWHWEVWGALTSWHSRTRLVSFPARTGDAPRRILQTAL